LASVGQWGKQSIMIGVTGVGAAEPERLNRATLDKLVEAYQGWMRR
jgi:hypothetical protein